MNAPGRSQARIPERFARRAAAISRGYRRPLEEPIISNERRLFARVAFAAQALLTSPKERLAVQVLDLSLKGALLRLPAGNVAAVGEPCLLNLSLAGSEDGIDMVGEIVHVEGDQVGLQCRSIDIESITHLRRLLEINLGDPQLLERELKALIAGS